MIGFQSQSANQLPFNLINNHLFMFFVMSCGCHSLPKPVKNIRFCTVQHRCIFARIVWTFLCVIWKLLRELDNKLIYCPPPLPSYFPNIGLETSVVSVTVSAFYLSLPLGCFSLLSFFYSRIIVLLLSTRVFAFIWWIFFVKFFFSRPEIEVPGITCRLTGSLRL